MDKEISPKKSLNFVARGLAVGTIALFPAYNSLNVGSSEAGFVQKDNIVDDDAREELLGEDQFEIQELKDLSRNEQISNFLEDNKIRSLIAAAFLTSLASSYLNYRLAKKHDDESLRKLRIAAPIFMSAAIGSLGVDSFMTIDRHIPAALFAGSVFIQAGYNLFNVYQRETRKDIRRSALVTSTGLIGVGLILLYVSDKI